MQGISTAIGCQFGGWLMVDDADAAEELRVEEWTFLFLSGNVQAAAAVELAGPPIRPSAVVAAVYRLLADERLMLVPMRNDDEEVNDDADSVEGGGRGR